MQIKQIPNIKPPPRMIFDDLTADNISRTASGIQVKSQIVDLFNLFGFCALF